MFQNEVHTDKGGKEKQIFYIVNPDNTFLKRKITKLQNILLFYLCMTVDNCW